MSTGQPRLPGGGGIRPLILSANDLGGGAGIAAYRLHKGLLQQDVDSRMLVQQRMSGDTTLSQAPGKAGRLAALVRPQLERLPSQWMYHPADTFHMQWLPGSPDGLSSVDGPPDVVNLHWICDGFQSVSAIGTIKAPVVWTLHDMWPFTGGCHYAGACTRYQQQCGQCPTLGSVRTHDASRWVHQRKRKAWHALDLTVVAPSRWLAHLAGQSSLLRDRPIRVIANGIDLDRFKPLDKHFCREALGLPKDRKLVLFGAMSGSPRKGAHHLRAALEGLQDTSHGIELVVFGNAAQQDMLRHLKTHYLGRISDEVTLALVYAAADVFVSPSEQDNLPNTMVESMACGTPCIAFDIGGMSDIIDHEVNGYLATPFDAGQLGSLIRHALADDARRADLSRAARAKALERFSIQDMARHYMDLFREVRQP